MGRASIMGFMGIFSSLADVGIAILAVYCMIMFIKLSQKAIKALDIYIDKNKDN